MLFGDEVLAVCEFYARVVLRPEVHYLLMSFFAEYVLECVKNLSFFSCLFGFAGVFEVLLYFYAKFRLFFPIIFIYELYNNSLSYT